MMRSLAVLALCLSGGAVAFAPANNAQTSAATTTTELNMMNKKAAASFLSAAFLATNAVSMAPVFAADFADSSQIVIAGRSGGRSGGRASSGSYAKSAPVSRSSTTTNVVHRTTVIQQPVYSSPAVVVAPSYGYGYGAPSPGLGLAVGLSAINSVGNAMQDARQENEIMRTREQLQDSKMKEAEMEARLRNIEMQQMIQASKSN